MQDVAVIDFTMSNRGDLEEMGSGIDSSVEPRRFDLGMEAFPAGECYDGSGEGGMLPHDSPDRGVGDPILQGLVSVDPTEAVAEEVDGFLGDFLHLASTTEGVASVVDTADSLEVTDADLAWLQDPDAFMPMPVNADDGPDGSDASCGNDLAPLTAISGAMQEASDEERPAVMTLQSDSDETSETKAPDVCHDSAASFKPEQRDRPSSRNEVRREKIRRYLEKKKRRKWSRMASYKSRQRVANGRPRHKGRFLPLETEFIPITELQRRQRALLRTCHDQQ